MTQDSRPALPFLPFALPEIGDEEIAEVVDTLKSGWVTTGPKAKRFEADFSAFLGDPGLDTTTSRTLYAACGGCRWSIRDAGVGGGVGAVTLRHRVCRAGGSEKGASIFNLGPRID